MKRDQKDRRKAHRYPGVGSLFNKLNMALRHLSNATMTERSLFFDKISLCFEPRPCKDNVFVKVFECLKNIYNTHFKSKCNDIYLSLQFIKSIAITITKFKCNDTIIKCNDISFLGSVDYGE